MKAHLAAILSAAAMLSTGGFTLPANAAVLTRAIDVCAINQCRVPKTESSVVNKVCFYIGEDYSNRFFCESGARTVSSIPESWKHKIKSIEVIGGGSVWICNDEDREGDCQHIDRSVRELSPDLFNNLRSYRTTSI